MADSAVSGGNDATGSKFNAPNRGSARGTMCRSQVSDSIGNGQAQIARQHEQIRKLVDDNEKMKEEIERISGSQYDYVKADKLSTIQSEVDALERRYQFEKMRKNDLIKRRQLARIELLHSRRLKGGVNVEKEQAEAIRAQVEILENRLQQALNKFNDALKYNKELRDRIDIIREERSVFARVHKKMDDDLRQKQRLMAESIEQTNKDMDERDNLQRQAEQLRQALRTQHANYEEKLCELNKDMDDIKVMRENQATMQLELETREYQFESLSAASNYTLASTNVNTNNASNNNRTANLMGDTSLNYTDMGSGGGNGHHGGVQTMTGFAGSTAATATGDDPFAGDDEEQDVYKAALRVDNEIYTITDIVARISEALHSDDMDALRREFVYLGDHNFSLYKYVNELTSTKELLIEQIGRLKGLLQSKREYDARQGELIRELEQQLACTEEKLSAVQSTVEQLRAASATVTEEAKSLYQQLGCSSSASSLMNTAQDNASSAQSHTELLLLPPVSSGASSNDDARQRRKEDDNKDEKCTTATNPALTTSRTTSDVGAFSEDVVSRSEHVAFTEANLMSFLGTIEERANLILCAYQRRRAHEQAGDSAATEEEDKAEPKTDHHTSALIEDRTKVDGSNMRSVISKGGMGNLSSRSFEHNSSHYREDASTACDRVNDDNISALPLLPSIPKTAHAAVSAQHLVRMSDLPSSSLGAQNEGSGMSALDRHMEEDKIVSHEQIRKQLERRLKQGDEPAKSTSRVKDNIKETAAVSRLRNGTLAPKRHK